MKICLAIGDRKCEDFIKSTLSILLAKLNEEGLDRITPLIEDIYNRPDYDNATKKEKKREILLEYFDGHEFLSSVSLTTLRTARNSGITEVEFVEEAPYREIVVDRCKGRGVDVLILSEMLPGQSNFQSICHELRVTYPSTRVIIAGGIHEKGDSFLKGLTEKGIYDIAYGETLSIMDIFKLLFHPNTYADSLKYLSNEQANNQPKDTNPFAGASNTLNVAPITPDKPAPKKESKIFSPKKKNEEAAPDVAVSRDTDLFEPEDEPVAQARGTELISDSDTGTLTDGLIAYPYDMKPVLITDRKMKTSKVVNPDGSTEISENLPAVIKTPRDRNYELYVTSLMTDDSSSNQGVLQSGPVRTASSHIPYGVKAKSLLFTSAIQGVGCSTMAFNIACLFANDFKKRVLFIDTNFGESSTFARFEIPNHIGISLDELVKNPSREKDILTKQVLLSYARGKDINRFSVLPDTLSFITWSRDLSSNISWILDHADEFEELLKKLSYSYDYIIMDSTLLIMNKAYDKLFQFADYIIPVVTQDIYSTNQTVNQLHYYDTYNIASKVRVIINRYDNIPPLVASTFSSEFYGADVYPVFDDNPGFIRARGSGIPYVSTKTARKRVIKAMKLFMSSV